MMTFIRNNCGRIMSYVFVLTWLCVAYTLGKFRHVLFLRTKGNMSLPITCAVAALSLDDLAVKYDATYGCQNLQWEWEHAYDNVSTYYEKQHVIVDYHNEPKVLEGPTRLPIIFNDGAYIDMFIEFTTTTSGHIRVMNILHAFYDLYGDNVPEAIMISMEMKNGNDFRYKTWNGNQWILRGVIEPFPFTTGIVYKITFKALGNVFQILVGDQQHVTYPFVLHSSEARQLRFDPAAGMLLHKIEYVA